MDILHTRNSAAVFLHHTVDGFQRNIGAAELRLFHQRGSRTDIRLFPSARKEQLDADQQQQQPATRQDQRVFAEHVEKAHKIIDHLLRNDVCRNAKQHKRHKDCRNQQNAQE
ncbi:hypothetical protein SDC9_188823 [bioreactor metagenome]|uniref:Uncharacterized protein n=1 Tax=bioreactor metagenome TaxID=1076179 RepID=A0A645HQZ4_9ZZZZ